jgi:hypothetical protein
MSSQKVLNTVSVVFSACSFIFFIVGCIGYASDDRTIKNVAWIVSDDHGFQLWSALQAYTFKATANDDYVGTIGFTNKFGDCALNDDDSVNDLCTTCLKDGNAAFGLLIVATVFATMVVVTSGALISTINSALQGFSAFAAFVSGCFSLVGFGLYMGSCYYKIDDQTAESLHYGPGAIIVLLGLLMMWVTVLMQVGAVILNFIGPKQV